MRPFPSPTPALSLSQLPLPTQPHLSPITAMGVALARSAPLSDRSLLRGPRAVNTLTRDRVRAARAERGGQVENVGGVMTQRADCFPIVAITSNGAYAQKTHSVSASHTWFLTGQVN
jgi:hypothetical protein